MGGKNEIKKIVREKFPHCFADRGQAGLPDSVSVEYAIEDINLAWFDFTSKRTQKDDEGKWVEVGRKTGRDLVNHLARNITHFLGKEAVRTFVVVIDKVRYVPLAKQPEQRKRDKDKLSVTEKQKTQPLDWRPLSVELRDDEQAKLDNRIIRLDEELPDMSTINANRLARQQAMREAFALLVQEVEVPLGKEVIIDGWDPDSDVPMRIRNSGKRGIERTPAPEYRNQTGESDTCIPFYVAAFSREDAARYKSLAPEHRQQLSRHFGGILIISKDTDMIPIALMHSEHRRVERLLPGEDDVQAYPTHRFANQLYIDLSVKQMRYTEDLGRYERVFPELCDVNVLYESLMRATGQRLNMFSICAVMMLPGNDYIDNYPMITHERFMYVLFEYFREFGNLFELDEDGETLRPSPDHYIKLICIAHYVKLVSQVTLRFPKHAKPLCLRSNFVSDKLYETDSELERAYNDKWPPQLVHISEMTRTEIRDCYNSRNRKIRFPSDEQLRERWKRMWWCVDYFWRSPHVEFDALPDITRLGWKVVEWDEFPGQRFCLRSDEDEQLARQAILDTRKRRKDIISKAKQSNSKRIKHNAELEIACQ